MHGSLEPEEKVLNWEIWNNRMSWSPDLPEDDPWNKGKVYPVSSSTTKLLGDLAMALYKSGWSPDDEFEVEGENSGDMFLTIRNKTINT